jgi:hypothetical protein
MDLRLVVAAFRERGLGAIEQPIETARRVAPADRLAAVGASGRR